jgi:hypothetical protein
VTLVVRRRDISDPPGPSANGKFPRKSTNGAAAPHDLAVPLPLHNVVSYPYGVTAEGISMVKETPSGPVTKQLTNFAASIVADTVLDNGVDHARQFEIEATQGGRSRTFSVPAEQFGSMGWVSQQLGSVAVVFPGNRDHARAAIQLLSTQTIERTVFTHTGWHQMDDGAWAFLHVGGANGAHGPVLDVAVQVDDPLSRFLLPPPPIKSDLADIVRSALKVSLSTASPQLMIPLLGCVFRAPFGSIDFSVSLLGPTGNGKTQLVSLVQQYFGDAMDGEHLPGNWSSTANALEEIAFQAKDVVLVVDDFRPWGVTDKIHQTADRLLRGAANGSGRGRLRSNISFRPIHAPRALIVSTGEEAFRGQSLNARVLTLEVGNEDVNWLELTPIQNSAKEGLFANAMSGFISYLAADYEHRQNQFISCRDDFLASARSNGLALHKRTPGQIANLAAGWEMYLQFAHDVGAITNLEQQEYSEQVWSALVYQAAQQGQRGRETNPVGAFSTGLAHCWTPAKLIWWPMMTVTKWRAGPTPSGAWDKETNWAMSLMTGSSSMFRLPSTPWRGS